MTQLLLQLLATFNATDKTYMDNSNCDTHIYITAQHVILFYTSMWENKKQNLKINDNSISLVRTGINGNDLLYT